MSKYCEISFRIALEKLPLIVGVLTQEVRDLRISEAAEGARPNGTGTVALPVRQPRIVLPPHLRRRKPQKRSSGRWPKMPMKGITVTTLREYLRTQPVGQEFTMKNVMDYFQSKEMRRNNAYGIVSLFNHYKVIERTGNGTYRRLQ